MRKPLAVAITLLILAVGANAEQISAFVTVDKASYLPGETVNWQIYAWANDDGANRGVALLALHLLEDRDEVLDPADTTGAGIFFQLANSAYNPFNGFTLNSAGTTDPLGGKLADINVSQNPSARILDQGQDDGTDPFPLFAEGSFALADNAFIGVHQMSVEVNAANYWPDGTNNAVAFETQSLTPITFVVEAIPEPATMVLSLLGLGGLSLIKRRRK